MSYPKSKYTFVEVDHISDFGDCPYNAKTSDGDKPFEHRFIPPYFFTDKLEPSKEFLWLLQSALQNDGFAQYKLCRMYCTGQDVEYDRLAAFWWCLRSASNGYRISYEMIGTAFTHCNHYYKDISQWDYYRGMQWYRKYNDSFYRIQIYEQRCNCFLSKEDRKKTVAQLVAEADELLNAAYQKKREEEEKIESELNRQSKLKRFKRTRSPSKEQLRENFDPFIFHPKRK